MAKQVTTTRKAKQSVKPTAQPVASAAVKKSSTIKANNAISMLKLRNWNLILAALHAVQGIAVLVLSTGKLFPVTTSFLAKDPLQSAAQHTSVLAPASHHLFDINLAYLVAVFFFLSALAHLSIATWYKSRYEKDLKLGLNKLRWIEYALSASTMIVGVGLLVGIQEISILIALFGLAASMNLCGLVMETHNKAGRSVNWLSYIIGSIAGIVPWLIIAIYLLGGALYGSSAPTFVYWIFVSIFLLFVSFAGNMFLQYRRVGKWSEYLYGERVYMILSLVAKSLLAWQVFAGALRP